MEIVLQEVNPQCGQKIIDAIKNQREETILIINSFGGSVRWGMKIYEAIRNARYPVTGIVAVEASSIAILILEACAERIIDRKAKIKFHDIHARNKNFLTKNLQKKIHETRSIIAEKISLRCKTPTEKIFSFIKEERKFSSEEALEFGLVDKIFE